MSHLDEDRLAVIAAGDPAIAEEHRHLAECDDCALELAELEHTVAVARSTVGLAPLESPPERVWEAIRGAIRDDASAASGPADGTAPEPSLRRPRWGMRTVFALAASVAVALSIVGVGNVLRPVPTVEVAAATLDAFPQHPEAVGSATVTQVGGETDRLHVELDAAAPGSGYREVWLIRPDASGMVSLGMLDGGSGEFAVPAGIDLREYPLVDISNEPDDGVPTHSGDSVVRGRLQFL